MCQHPTLSVWLSIHTCTQSIVRSALEKGVHRPVFLRDFAIFTCCYLQPLHFNHQLIMCTSSSSSICSHPTCHTIKRLAIPYHPILNQLQLGQPHSHSQLSSSTWHISYLKQVQSTRQCWGATPKQNIEEPPKNSWPTHKRHTIHVPISHSSRIPSISFSHFPSTLIVSILVRTTFNHLISFLGHIYSYSTNIYFLHTLKSLLSSAEPGCCNSKLFNPFFYTIIFQPNIFLSLSTLILLWFFTFQFFHIILALLNLNNTNTTCTHFPRQRQYQTIKSAYNLHFLHPLHLTFIFFHSISRIIKISISANLLQIFHFCYHCSPLTASENAQAEVAPHPLSPIANFFCVMYRQNFLTIFL